MSTPPRWIAGLMSGTSADGIDVAIVNVAASVSLVAHSCHPYPRELQERIQAVRQTGSATLRELTDLTRQITLAYAEALRGALTKSGLQSNDLTALAAHGQTLFHDPPLTLQVFDPSLLTIETGCAVVSDFRRADLAVGGQGAPLVPFADHRLFAHPTRDRAIVNIGGIANVTLLPAGSDTSRVIAFDTGPGNCVSDHLCRLHHPIGPGYDAGGNLAARGGVDADLLAHLLDLPYHHRPAPKSTDGPEMIDAFTRAVAKLARSLSFENQLATAVTWSADAIAKAIPPSADVYVAGGGAHNRVLMDRLRSRCPNVRLTDELGIPSAAREAIAFALLADATLQGRPSNLPSVTGANRPVVLGSITPKP
ncbi:MAG: anhydro-N-acetylmuramic acid kinase [Tepidisphaeraceae bacterium]